MTELAKRLAEDGEIIEPDESERTTILHDDIEEERRLAREKGLVWTPWRLARPGEKKMECGSDHHRKSHTRRLLSSYVSYGTTYKMVTVLCSLCHARLGGSTAHNDFHQSWHYYRGKWPGVVGP